MTLTVIPVHRFSHCQTVGQLLVPLLLAYFYCGVNYLGMADDLQIHTARYVRASPRRFTFQYRASARTALAQTTRGKGSSLSTCRPTTASLAFCAHPQLALSGVHNNMPSFVFLTGFNDEAWTQESRPHPAMRAVFLSFVTSRTLKGLVHGYLSF